MRRWIAGALQISGAVVLAVGGWFIAPFIGLFILGVCAILFGLALERE